MAGGYEAEMRGEKKKADFGNATTKMVGEKPKKMAMGGVAKMRKGVADKSGAPRHMAKRDMSKKGC